jgi:hypothetical protein
MVSAGYAICADPSESIKLIRNLKERADAALYADKKLQEA